MAIHRAWRLRGIAGALVGGVSFIVPGLVLILDMESRRDCFVAQAVARPVGRRQRHRFAHEQSR